MSDERWLPIPEWEGWYEASDHGNIRSVDRVVQTAEGPRRYRGKVLKPGVQVKDQSRYVNLARGGPKVSRLVAHLVLETFVGKRPPGMLACHWDDDQANNRLSNLRWDTRLANAQDAIRNRKLVANT